MLTMLSYGSVRLHVLWGSASQGYALCWWSLNIDRTRNDFERQQAEPRRRVADSCCSLALVVPQVGLAVLQGVDDISVVGDARPISGVVYQLGRTRRSALLRRSCEGNEALAGVSAAFAVVWCSSGWRAGCVAVVWFGGKACYPDTIDVAAHHPRGRLHRAPRRAVGACSRRRREGSARAAKL